MNPAIPQVIGDVLGNVVRQVVKEGIASSDIPLSSAAPVVAANAVAEEVEARIVENPRVQHVTNTEPWWRSRVTWGAVTAILSGGFGISALAKAGSTDGALYTPFVMSIVGGAGTLYGRWKARTPLFTAGTNS